MILKRLILREIVMPLVEPFRISSGYEDKRRILLVELVDVDGETVFAESVAGSAPNYAPETVDTNWMVIGQYVAARVLHKPFAHPKHLHQVMEANFRGNNMAKAAVEMGCWALYAQKQGISLSHLLGGTRQQVKTGISIGVQANPNELVKRARAAFEQGYAKIKVKIQPGADLEYLAAVRQELGPDVPIMGDANNAYSPADFAHLKKMDAFNMMMLEQPLAWDDVLRHADLQKIIKTPICLDESIVNLDRAHEMIRLKAGRIINIKPGRVGGFSPALAIHELAVSAQMPVWCGGMLESGVGRAYNVALASLPGFSLPGDLSPSSRYWERDVVTPEWTMDDESNVSVPFDKPGLGVTVDRNHLDNLTTRMEILQ